MMKKTICLLLSVCLLMGLSAGCTDEPKDPVDPTTTTTTATTTEPSSDEGTTTETPIEITTETPTTTTTAEATTTTESTTTTTTETGTTVTTTVAPAVKSVAATTEKKFETLPAEQSVLLNKNPDRGFRSELIVDMPAADNAAAFEKWTYEAVLNHVKKEVYQNALDESVTVSRLYFYLAEYTQLDAIPDQAIEMIRRYMKAHMEVGIKVCLVFYYQRSDTVCPDADILLKHMDQIAKLLEEFKNGISSLCFGLIGRYGEWTSASHVTEPERKIITEKMLSILPEGMYLTMRQPIYKWNNVPKDSPRYKMIGFANDACFGMDGTHSETWKPGSETYRESMKEAPYGFNDGELFTTKYFRNNGVYVKGLSVVENLSQLRTNTFSIWHGYGDYSSIGGTIQESVFYGWKCEEVTVEWLKEKGLPYSPTWFTNVKGKTLQRNAFEYLRDYLGYRFSMTDLKVTGGTKGGEEIQIAAELVNYGMAAGMNLESGFAILDESGKVLSEVKVGNPADWHCTDPTDYSKRELLKHSLATSMKLPETKGTYQLAFFVRNAMGQYARLDNTVPFVDGYHILHMFTID